MRERDFRKVSTLLAVSLLTACHGGGSRGTVWEGPVTQRDSVVRTQMRLWDLGRSLDSVARSTGRLPGSLDPSLIPGTGKTTDIWGRGIEYRQRGLAFELRSPGPDGALDNGDDVVALGRVGRNLPCETRDQYGTRRYEEIVAPCSEAPALIFPPCPSLLELRATEGVATTAGDSALLTGRRLVRFARIIDGVGRERGGLPPSFRAIPGHPQLPNGGVPDSWGQPVAYTHDRQRFELRSAGPDAQFQSADDIVVEGQLGQAVPCAFATANGTVTCDTPPPACP